MQEKKNSEAKIRANNKYTAKHYDRINMALPKGSRPLVEYCAGLFGESLNRYVCRVLLEAVRRDIQGQDMQDASLSGLLQVTASEESPLNLPVTHAEEPQRRGLPRDEPEFFDLF